MSTFIYFNLFISLSVYMYTVNKQQYQGVGYMSFNIVIMPPNLIYKNMDIFYSTKICLIIYLSHLNSCAF